MSSATIDAEAFREFFRAEKEELELELEEEEEEEGEEEEGKRRREIFFVRPTGYS